MARSHFQGCDPAILRQVLAESALKWEENSKSYIFTCPRCHGQRKLYIRKADGRFVCWKCKEVDGYEGRPEFALADLLAIRVKQAEALLYGGSGAPASVWLDVKVEDFFGDDDEEDEDAAPRLILHWPHDYYELDEPEAARGVAYLESRGVPLEVARQYGIRYSPVERRVVFPIESHGQLYGWQGRLVVPHENYVGDELVKGLKIESTKGIERQRALMFVDRVEGRGHALLGEGPFDALKGHLFGGNCSPMGKAVQRGQVLELLHAGVRRLYSGLDPDAADELMRLVREYFDDLEIYRLAITVKGAKEKPDLGAMSFREVDDLARGAERIRAGQLFVYVRPDIA